MPKADEILAELSALAPPQLAEEWDNVGLLVQPPLPVDRVLVALDITQKVIQEAQEKCCQLIVSHHPVIFQPLGRLLAGEPAAELLRRGMGAICMHTNLDSAQGGVNDRLCEIFGLTQTQPVAGMGRMGLLQKPCSAGELAELCQKKLGGPVQYVPGQNPISRLAVLGGAGGDFVQAAYDAGADCLLTGEARHHEALLAKRLGIALLAAGHFETEWPVVQVLADRLRGRFADLWVGVSEADASPFCHT